MNAIHPLDPVYQPSFELKYNGEVFTAKLTDDNDDPFDCLITYYWYEVNGELFVNDFNYRAIQPIQMTDDSLEESVMYAIEEREGKISFRDAENKARKPVLVIR